MEVGPTTHYIMGGVRVDSDTQMSTLPGLFAAGECAAGINGANRLGGNSLSDLLVFGKRAGEFAAQYAKAHQAGVIDSGPVEEAVRRALAPFERAEGGAKGDNPFEVQRELQEMMQDQVGIVRHQEEMLRALDGIGRLSQRARQVVVQGNREYNPGWHAALDLENLLTVAEAVTRCAIERKESRGAQFREDYPAKDDAFGKVNLVVAKSADGAMQLHRYAIPPLPENLKQIIEEMK